MIKNITLSASEELIKKAREKAEKEKSSLNERFREWLRNYTGKENFDSEFDKIEKKLEYIDSGKKFTREEMNER